jgi:hypothetical protein
MEPHYTGRPGTGTLQVVHMHEAGGGTRTTYLLSTPREGPKRLRFTNPLGTLLTGDRLQVTYNTSDATPGEPSMPARLGGGQLITPAASTPATYVLCTASNGLDVRLSSHPRSKTCSRDGCQAVSVAALLVLRYDAALLFPPCPSNSRPTDGAAVSGGLPSIVALQIVRAARPKSLSGAPANIASITFVLSMCGQPAATTVAVSAQHFSTPGHTPTRNHHR